MTPSSSNAVLDRAGGSKFLGLDMGGSNIRAAVVDGSGLIIESTTAPLPNDLDARREAPIGLALKYADRVDGFGLAIAGTVVHGRLTWSANLGLANVDYDELFEQHLGRPVAVLNDARAAGLAEARVGAGAGARHVLLVTVGTGIGGAIIIDGQLVEGGGDAGEIGHMVIDPRGPACGCGRTGCWETFVGGRALARRAAEIYPSTPDPLIHLLSHASSGDTRAEREVDEVCSYFAIGLDNLAAIISPDVIVLGGGVIARGGMIADRYQDAGSRLRWSKAPLKRSVLGDTAGQIGAALAAGSNLNSL